jgi:phenylacetate-CoA ligase
MRELDWRADYADLRRQQQPPLSRQLESVWRRSHFYRRLWGSPPDADRFTGLPLVTKSDLHAALAEPGFMGSNLAWPISDLAHIHTSSGTSGKPTYFALSARDYRAWMRTFTRGFELAGMRRGDRVLHAFAMARGYAGGVPMIEALETMGCVALPIGAEAGSVRLVDALARLQPDVVYASPSMLRRLGQAYEEENGGSPAGTSVRLVLTGGEPGAGDPESKQQLRDMWGADVREAGGGTDVCPLMFVECDRHDGLHFVAGDDVLLEIIDPESCAALEVIGEVEGEIVYTHLFREASPIVRMRHGDIVHINARPCACGIGAPRLRFRGRSDDMLIVRGVKVFPSSIQAVAAQFRPALTGAIAVRRPAQHGSIDGPLWVVCECATESASDALREAFERRARDAIGVRVACELVGPGSLSVEGGQKGKLVLDE